MRAKGAAALAGSVLVAGLALLAGLTSHMRERLASLPGFASPLRLDSRTVKIKLGSDYYRIPANFLDSPLQVTGKDSGYRVVDGILLIGSPGGFEGRTRQTGYFFGSKPGCCVWVNVHAYKGVSGVDSTSIALRSKLREHIVTKSNSARETIYVMAGSEGGPRSGEISDLFIPAGRISFTSCDRVQPPRVSASCRMYDYIGDISYAILFNRIHMQDRDRISQEVKARLKSWIVKSEVDSKLES